MEFIEGFEVVLQAFVFFFVLAAFLLAAWEIGSHLRRFWRWLRPGREHFPAIQEGIPGIPHPGGEDWPPQPGRRVR